ncbi:hypothetical protein F8388_005489 [Cannabis sativa]|uniref:Uncharacterized protein n=1 Tax=Cannabis sativa TaxID=3483 RepID=A0A7J6GY34_CANSA|nr:hypothetical protein F8388_005489 [Cannabis sativa]
MKEGKSLKLNGQLNHQNGHLSPFKFAKLFDPEASWDKDQLGDVLHWIRQVVALVCGLLWGAIPLVGGIWFMMPRFKLIPVPCIMLDILIPEERPRLKLIVKPFFALRILPVNAAILRIKMFKLLYRQNCFLALSSGIIYGYYAMILKVDEEDFGGHGALLQEGLFASVTLFLLAWVLVYSLGHF